MSHPPSSRSVLPVLPLLLLLAGSFGLGGCELQEVSLAEPEDVLVAEAYLLVGDGKDEITAFLHRTLGAPGATELSRARVRLGVEGGESFLLLPAPRGECLFSGDVLEVDGVCFSAPPDLEGILGPGANVQLEIELLDGRRLRGATTVPEELTLLRPGEVESCALLPGRALELVWNRAPGAWAYAGETLLWNLRDALAPRGVAVEEDSLALLGLAVSAQDTTLVFPREFGIFERFDLDRDLAVALQEGLPEGASAEVVVAALDRNYVNWVRGGDFNPSGQVRVPSLTGDGIGVVASAVRRSLLVEGAVPGPGLPSCLSGG